ncbi:hypothetical protein JVU11DRAFT_731 [Chiua virens]|nr:hypothetical protein JVU11DRAFT_731 [Chiua virens]
MAQVDPNLEAMPNYRGQEFSIIRQGLRNGFQETDDQVVARLIAAWESDRDARVAAWNAQREAEDRAAEDLERERRFIQEQEELAAAEEAERLRVEAEKKKPKMSTIVPGTSVPDSLTLPPSQFALQKLATFDYVELWYFTPAGCADAAKYHSKSQADDTFGISKLDDHLTVRSIASVRASKNVVPDSDLSFSDFIHARNGFLNYAKKANWPNDNLNALAKFFWYIENHPRLKLPLGEKTVLTYAARVRLDWHREIKATNKPYDISLINHQLMSTISDEIRILDEERTKNLVRSFLTPSLPLLTFVPPFLIQSGHGYPLAKPVQPLPHPPPAQPHPTCNRANSPPCSPCLAIASPIATASPTPYRCLRGPIGVITPSTLVPLVSRAAMVVISASRDATLALSPPSPPDLASPWAGLALTLT